MAADNGKYPEILADLRDGLLEVLEGEEIEAEKARQIAFAAAEHIRTRWAGMAIYIPKGQAWQLDQRDMEIYRRFRPEIKKELCREYGISEQRLYQIVAAVRAEKFAKKQLKLF